MAEAISCPVWERAPGVLVAGWGEMQAKPLGVPASSLLGTPKRMYSLGTASPPGSLGVVTPAGGPGLGPGAGNQPLPPCVRACVARSPSGSTSAKRSTRAASPPLADASPDRPCPAREAREGGRDLAGEQPRPPGLLVLSRPAANGGARLESGGRSRARAPRAGKGASAGINRPRPRPRPPPPSPVCVMWWGWVGRPSWGGRRRRRVPHQPDT